MAEALTTHSTEILPKLRALLRHRGRSDLADLLTGATLHFGSDDGTLTGIFESSRAKIVAPVEAHEKLRLATESDRRSIILAINEIRTQLGGPTTAYLSITLNVDSLVEDPELPQPTGWALVDRQIAEARSRLAHAVTAEQFQAVGLVCREALISLAQAVHDPARHVSPDEVKLSSSDATRMLDSFIAVELTGASHEESRRHAKAALSLANSLQHRRTATFRPAALCVEATSSVVNLIAIISGKRDP